jgi:integrase/recombinase XerD
MGKDIDTADRLTTGFEVALLRENLAKGTRVKYMQIVREFVAQPDGDVLTATRFDAEAYLDRLTGEAGLSAATIRLRIAALRRFYDHLEDRELLEGRNPFGRIKAPKRRRKPIDWLRDDEDAALANSCVTRQERIVHALLRYAGLRIGEAMALIQRNVDLERGELFVADSKTDSGFRTVPIRDELKTELVAWLSHLESKGQRRADLPVLVTRNGTPMKAQFGWRLIKRAAARAGVRPLPEPKLSAVTPHTLRRTFGTELLNKGMALEHLSKLLGHADTRVTEASYAEMLHETVRAAAIHAWSS